MGEMGKQRRERGNRPEDLPALRGSRLATEASGVGKNGSALGTGHRLFRNLVFACSARLQLIGPTGRNTARSKSNMQSVRFSLFVVAVTCSMSARDRVTRPAQLSAKSFFVWAAAGLAETTDTEKTSASAPAIWSVDSPSGR
jgi:hypothetical protein